MVAKIRDSSLDYRTYWLQGGQYYERRGLEGLGASCRLPMDKLRGFSDEERKAIALEADSDSAFCRQLAKCLETDPDCSRKISRSMREAVANELDSRKFKGRAGTWPKLRAKVRSLMESAFQEVDKTVDSLPLGRKMEIVVAIGSGRRAVTAMSGLGDLFGDLFSGIGDYFSSRVIAGAQRNIAGIQANAAIQVANAQMSVAQANAAIAAANERISNPISSAVSTLTTTTVAGIPIFIPILGLVGLGLYFAFGRK